MSDTDPENLWKFYGFDPAARESWIKRPHQGLDFRDLSDGGCLLMAVTSDSHAIQLGKFKSRAAAIDAVMLFSLRVGEFDPAHFAPQVRERAAAVVADEVDATEEERRPVWPTSSLISTPSKLAARVVDDLLRSRRR